MKWCPTLAPNLDAEVRPCLQRFLVWKRWYDAWFHEEIERFLFDDNLTTFSVNIGVAARISRKKYEFCSKVSVTHSNFGLLTRIQRLFLLRKLKDFIFWRYFCNGLNYFSNCQMLQGLYLAHNNKWRNVFELLIIKIRHKFKNLLSVREWSWKQDNNIGSLFVVVLLWFLPTIIQLFIEHLSL